MKTLSFYLMGFLFVILLSCNKQKTEESTVMQYFTPRGYFPEKFNGKIQKLTEKNYWAIIEDGKYLKGEQITRKELDSINWINDYEVGFDRNGLIEYCNGFDENGKIIWKYQLKIENNKYLENQLSRDDTIRYYEEIKYNNEGELSEIQRYRYGADTLIVSLIIQTIANGDSIVILSQNNRGEKLNKYTLYKTNDNKSASWKYFDKEDNYMGGSDFFYNEKGTFQKINYLDKDSKIENWEEYVYFEYDNKENMVFGCYKDSLGRIAITERTIAYFEP